MKIVTIIGARPQFIKAAAVSRILRETHNEILIHTGQHYDSNMSDIFFEELKIPIPNHNLHVGSASHAKQTAAMMIGIEEILIKEKPNYLMVYGDTNSTLAGTIAAGKMLIPIIHIEAGLRSFNLEMPEEQNRVLTDRISKFLFCPTETAVDNLMREGITNGVYNVGDVMCDAVLNYSEIVEEYSCQHFLSRLQGVYDIIPQVKEWYFATIHRAENTDSVNKIAQILSAFEKLDAPVIFPVHPRTQLLVHELNKQYQFNNIIFVKPIGYLDVLYFAKYAKKIITDSGGLQKEAYLLNTPCITVRDQTEWVETLIGNNNILAKPESDDIICKVYDTVIDFNVKLDYYGSGDAARKICNILKGVC